MGIVTNSALRARNLLGGPGSVFFFFDTRVFHWRRGHGGTLAWPHTHTRPYPRSGGDSVFCPWWSPQLWKYLCGSPRTGWRVFSSWKQTAVMTYDRAQVHVRELWWTIVPQPHCSSCIVAVTMVPQPQMWPTAGWPYRGEERTVVPVFCI